MPPPAAADEVRLEISTAQQRHPRRLQSPQTGVRLVFAALSKGREGLWLRSLNDPGGEGRCLGPRVHSFHLVPGQRSIGFFADARLKRIDVASGAVQTLAAAGNPYGAAWNGDDTVPVHPGRIGSRFPRPSDWGVTSPCDPGQH